MTLRLPPPVAAEGQVLGPDGQPVAEIPLWLELRQLNDNRGWLMGQVTDAQGRFRFSDLNAQVGEYWLTLPVRQNYQPTSARLRTDGRPTVIRLEKGHVLEGQLLDARTGWPLAGVEMYAFPMESTNSETDLREAEGKTDSQGRFRFSNLAKVAYRFNDRNGLTWENSEELHDVTPDRAAPLVLRATLPSWSPLQPVPPAP